MTLACLQFAHAHFSHSLQVQRSNRQNIGMETQIATGKQKREDLEVVARHAKEDLFVNVKFICDQRVELAVGGRIHQDKKIKCKDQLGSHLPPSHWFMHLKGVWTDALTKHAQKNALAMIVCVRCCRIETNNDST
jgi:hypothetical protein